MDNLSAMLAEVRAREWAFREKARLEQTKRDEQPRILPERAMITVSREYGTSGRIFASLLKERLGAEWQIWDSEIVDEIARNANVRRELVQNIDERARTMIEHILDSTLNYTPIDGDEYVKHLTQALVSLAHQGQKIIVGRGANFILTQALNIRLVASVGYRARSIEEAESLSHAEALAKLRRTDSARQGYIRTHFQNEIGDQCHYDLVMCLDHLSMEAAADAAAAAARRHMAEPPNHPHDVKPAI